MSTISLETSRNSKYCVKVLFLNLGSIAPVMQYGLSVLNPMQDVIKDVYNETYQERYGESMTGPTWHVLESLTMSIILAGAFFGALFFRILLKLASRKHSTMVIHCINIIGCVIASVGGGLSGSWEVLIIGRFITGLALGLGINMLPLFNGELSSIEQVETYQGLIGVGLAIGNFLGVLFGWKYLFGRDNLWAIALALPIIPSFAYLCLASWLVETPFYVLKHEGPEDTLQLLRKIRKGREECIKRELAELIGPQAMVETKGLVANNGNGTNRSDVEVDKLLEKGGSPLLMETKTIGISQVIKIKQYRRQFVAVCILYMAIMFSGLMDTLLYSTTIFLNAGIEPSMTATVTVCVFFLQVLATIPGGFIMHRFGSWLLCVLGLVVIIVSHIVLTISLSLGWSYLSIFAIILYFIGFSGFMNIAVFAVISEITTTKSRPICVAFGGSLLWFTGWLTGFISSYLKRWLGEYSPLVWMTLSSLVLVYMLLCVPNTKKKTPEEIQNYFKK